MLSIFVNFFLNLQQRERNRTAFYKIERQVIKSGGKLFQVQILLEIK